jgi:PAS domain S-box-containing protein
LPIASRGEAESVADRSLLGDRQLPGLTLEIEDLAVARRELLRAVGSSVHGARLADAWVAFKHLRIGVDTSQGRAYGCESIAEEPMNAEMKGEGSQGVDRIRSVAQLNMLHSLAAKLNTLGSVEEIGAAITGELRTLIDYHNCRVYLLQPDGHTLLPIAFRGDLFKEYQSETLEDLITLVGEGITGHVARTGESLLTPNAQEVKFAVQIEGTDDVVESMLVVPTKLGDHVTGVIVLSSLGYGKFDEQDQRLLEVLASHAAVAFENAQLLQRERRAADASRGLLSLSQALIHEHTVGDILQEAIERVPRLLPCIAVGAYVKDAESGDFRLARLHEAIAGAVRPRAEIADVTGSIAEGFLSEELDPFVLDEEIVGTLPEEYWFTNVPGDVLAAPLRWEPDGSGAIVAVAPAGTSPYGEDEVRMARGIADISSLALGNARRLSELERFHELVETLDAVFWEADAATLGFTFLGGRAEGLLGEDAETWVDEGRTWGSHIAAADRAQALADAKAAVEGGRDHSLEYRVIGPRGSTIWIRDLVHVVAGGQGVRELRGLMVDITDRKRAEQSLRESERQYSEAFRKEREAAQRLRALDDMKNTFLEAVSHDLRTPLTSILGSALTLEQSQFELPREDAVDLVHRIATNARKLERLLSDLLDLDRLQRGIVSPKRRPTDLEALVRRGVAETENPTGHRITVDVEPATVSVDAAKVERILENLISNAIRHTPPETPVWIRARRQDGGVLLVVEDAGPGVPADLHEAVFEPFRQAPGSAAVHSPGVGVGLSLVLRFAELHGGRAWLEDREGGGASFRVFLPGG